MCGVSLKPKQKRRLRAEMFISSKFNNFRECADACNKLAKQLDSSATFNRLSIQQYVGCKTNLSMKRLKILAELLNITDYKQLDEVFVAPENRMNGSDWIGDNGSIVKDFDISNIIKDKNI